MYVMKLSMYVTKLSMYVMKLSIKEETQKPLRSV